MLTRQTVSRSLVTKWVLVAVLLLAFLPLGTSGERTRWVSVKEIYSQGKHNGWPDLCRWRDKYYVVFPAHGVGHQAPHDVVVLASDDAEQWESVLDTPPTDWQLEDDETWPAETLFFLPTEKRLYLLYWASARDNTDVSEERRNQLKKQWMELGGNENSWQRWLTCHEQSYRTRLRYTEDGRTWSQPQQLLDPGWWLWRPQTFGGKHYMVGFSGQAQQWQITSELTEMIPLADTTPLGVKRGWGIELFRAASLFVSDDGLAWSKVSNIGNRDDGEPGLHFSPDGRALVVSRNGSGFKHAIAYVGHPPYHHWRSIQLDQTIHQAAVIYHKNRWIVGGRYLDEATFEPNRFDPVNALQSPTGTRLWFLDDQTGELTVATTLPSWGDCGQPAFLPTPEGDLLVAYYSCSQTIDRNLAVGGGPHPGKYSPTSIYLARVVIE